MSDSNQKCFTITLKSGEKKCAKGGNVFFDLFKARNEWKIQKFKMFSLVLTNVLAFIMDLDTIQDFPDRIRIFCLIRIRTREKV